MLSNLTEAHNNSLANLIEKLGKSNKDVNFISVDFNNLTDQLFSEPSNFGLTNTTQGATNTDIYNNTFDFSLLDPEALNAAKERAETYFFWDSVHPTSKVHSLIADYVLDTLQSKLIPSPTLALSIDPSPVTINLALSLI